MELQVKAAPATAAFSAFRRKRQVTRVPLHIYLLPTSSELSRIHQRPREIIFSRKYERILFQMLTLEVLTSLTSDSHSIARGDLEIAIKLFSSRIYVEITLEGCSKARATSCWFLQNPVFSLSKIFLSL